MDQFMIAEEVSDWAVEQFSKEMDWEREEEKNPLPSCKFQCAMWKGWGRRCRKGSYENAVESEKQ